MPWEDEVDYTYLMNPDYQREQMVIARMEAEERFRMQYFSDPYPMDLRAASGVATRARIEAEEQARRFETYVRRMGRINEEQNREDALRYLMGNFANKTPNLMHHCVQCGEKIGSNYFRRAFDVRCEKCKPSEDEIKPGVIPMIIMSRAKDMSASDAYCKEAGIKVKQDYGVRPNANDAYNSFSQTMGLLIGTAIKKKRENFSQRTNRDGLHLLGSTG